MRHLLDGVDYRSEERIGDVGDHQTDGRGRAGLEAAGDGVGLVADLLDEVGSLLDNFLESGFGPLGGVHLVDCNNELPYAKSECKKSVFCTRRNSPKWRPR